MGEAADALLKPLSAAVSWPIYIRDAEGVPVAETTLTSMIASPPSLEKGQYFAAVELPTGKQLTQRFDVSDDGSLDLTPLLAGARSALESIGTAAAAHLPAVNRVLSDGLFNFTLPSAFLAGSAFLLSGFSGIMGMGVSNPPDTTVEGVTAYRGTALGPGATVVPAAANRIPGSDVLSITAPDGDRPSTFHFSGFGPNEFNLILLPGSTATVTTDGATDVTTGDDFADQLLRFRAAGKMHGLSALTSVLNTDSVRSRLDRPPAALAIAYRMLRVRHTEIDNAVSVLEPLAHFADTIILRAERMALQGKHLQALDLFIQAGETDLPAFSYGLSLLTDRLRRYAGLGDKGYEPELSKAGLPTDAPVRATAALSASQTYAARCAFDSPLTYYEGSFKIQASEPASKPQPGE